jgi:helicase MOV-10
VDSQIGVISPYNAQNAKIRAAINTQDLKKNRPGVLKVGSVEEFQGQVGAPFNSVSKKV